MISLRRRLSISTSSGERRNQDIQPDICLEAGSAKQLNGAAFTRPTRKVQNSALATVNGRPICSPASVLSVPSPFIPLFV